jgi:hypothetical protein
MTLAWIIIAAAFAFDVWLYARTRRHRAELSKYEVHLEEREKRVEEGLLALKNAEMSTVLYQAQYVVTDSDAMKYCTDDRIKRNAKKQLAYTIASDIVKNIEPEETQTAEGRRMFRYRIKVKK